MDDVDFEFWLKKENWSELEARYLLTGLMPFYDGKQPFLSDNFFPDKTEEWIEDINEEFKDNVKAILSGINYGSLEVVHATGDYLYYRKGWTAQPLDVLVATRYFNKAKLLKWAIDEGLNIPKELISWYMKYQARLIPEYEQPPKAKPMEQSDKNLRAENESLKAENEALKKQLAEQEKPLSWQRDKTLNHIIAVLLDLSLSDKKFHNQADLVNHITENYRKFYGLGKTSLDTTLSDAKKALGEESKRLQVK